MANAEVTSGIVGYQQITVGTGYHLFTVTFKNVAGGDFDVQDIVPYLNGSVVEANAAVTVQKMGTDGGYLQVYGYRKGKGGWCKGLTLQDRGVVTFKDGEAFCVYNNAGGEITLQVSGQVEINPWSAEVATGYSLVGNMTPVKIDIQDIIPYNMNGEEITGNATVTLQKMGADGGYLQVYGYRKGKGGWCKGLTLQSRGTVEFEPGESACLYNNTGATVQLKFKSPVAGE